MKTVATQLSAWIRQAAGLALLIPAVAAQATLFVHDPVTNYTAGAITSQGPAALGFSGTWSGETGVVLADAAGLAYPANVVAQSAGGRFVISHSQTAQTTGRTTSRSITGSGLPTSGPLHFSALLAIDATSLAQLAGRPANYVQYIGVRTSDLNSGRSSTVATFPTAGVFVGFRADGSGGVGLALGVNGTAYPMTASVTADEPYFCVVRIAPQAGTDGKEVVDAVVNPSASGLVGGIGSASAEAEALASGQTFTHVTIGGYHATGNGKTSFDEFRMADSEADVAPLASLDLFVSSAAATDIGCFSATANGRLNLSGATADVFLDWWRTGVATNTLAVGTFTESTDLVSTLDGLRPDTEYAYRHRVEKGVEAVTSAVVIAFSTPGAVTFSDIGASNVLQTLHLGGTATHAGVAPTTVTLWFGETGGSLAPVQSWPDVASGAALSHSIADVAWGGSYDYVFQAEYTYGGETFAYGSATNTFTVAATAVWTGGAGSADWCAAGNWDLNLVPTSALDASFLAASQGLVVTSSLSALTSKRLVLRPDGTLGLDLGADTVLTTDGAVAISSSSSSTRSDVTLLSGAIETAGNALSMNARFSRASLTVASNAVVSVGAIGMNMNLASEQTITVAPGGRLLASAGSEISASRSGLLVQTGGVAVVSGFTVSGGNSFIVADGGVITNNSGAVLGYFGGNGSSSGNRMEVANGGQVCLAGTIYKYPESSLDICNTYQSWVVVRDGGLLETASGIRIGGGNSSADGGGVLTVSNAALRVNGTVWVARNSSYSNQSLLVHADEPFGAQVAIAGTLSVGGVAASSTARGHGNRFVATGGTVEVGGAMVVGAATASATNNLFRVNAARARVNAASLAMRNQSRLEFEIDGMPADAPVSIAGDVSLDATTRLTVDATACKEVGVYTLLKGGDGTFDYAIPAENVSLLFDAGFDGKLIVSTAEKKIAVRIHRTSLTIIVR